VTAVRNAWHFIGSNWRTSTGGLLVEIGKPLIHVGDLIPCVSGLHASTRAIDALRYACGPVVTLVECEGEFVDDNGDKFVCRKRTAIWGYDATDELWAFARLAALEVLHLWPEAPAVVREFLETGDEDLRAAASEAASACAWVTAWDAASAGAWVAARVAARDAAWAFAWVAARDAASSAASPAARAVALSRLNEILESVLFDGAVSRGLVRP
jgi:hypothetical protein